MNSMQWWIVIGLGNPGDAYAKSRHNAGFIVVDAIAAQWNLTWHLDKKHQSEIAESQEHHTILVKPQTFMNDSGIAVQSVMHFYKETIDHLVIVYDDLDIVLGDHKFQFGTHPKIHNGVNSVILSLGTDQFWNLRIGTDTREGDRTIDNKEYVLSGFSKDQQKMFQSTILQAVEELRVKITAP